MAEQVVKFQHDVAGLAAAVAKSLLAGSASPAWGETTAKSPLWRRVLRVLLGPRRWERLRMAACLRRLAARSAKPILVYMVPFDIWKLRTGGGQRIAGIAKAASQNFNVLVVTSVWSRRTFAHQELRPDCHMLAVPAGAGFMERLRVGGGAGLFAFPDHFDLLPEFRAILDILTTSARAWVFECPVAWPVIKRFRRLECPVCYDAPNDYSRFLQNSYGCTDEQLVERLVSMERDALTEAKWATFCTDSDRIAARARCPDSKSRMLVVPNGVDIETCRLVLPGHARENGKLAGLDRPVAVFMGAHHKPNLLALDCIVRDLAPAFPQVVFAVAGIHLAAYRECGGFQPGANVVFAGSVSEEIKEALFAVASVALAPMKSGTGSSLKIPEYVACGKIVVGSPIGLRGFEELLAFPSIIAAHDVRAALGGVLDRLEADSTSYDASCSAARKWVESNFDWSRVARPLVEELKELVPG